MLSFFEVIGVLVAVFVFLRVLILYEERRKRKAQLLKLQRYYSQFFYFCELEDMFFCFPEFQWEKPAQSRTKQGGHQQYRSDQAQQRKDQSIPTDVKRAFTVLDLAVTRDVEKVKLAYRRLRKEYYPAMEGRNPNKEKFEQVQASWDLITKWLEEK